MANSLNKAFSIHYFTWLVLLFLISACASVQSPTGGPRDTEPPKIVKETPKNLTRNFSAKEIQIEFDEFIKLVNEYTEISISPAIDIPPVYKARKQILEIKFDQKLEEKTTYTINFGKAITDVNESNVLKNYTYVFSTGNEIDSLSIGGNVINSITREKLKDVTVFILPVRQDSLFGKKKASIFTTTDSAGNFKLQNLREDIYRIYALQEQGGDRIYNGQNEQIAFLNDTLVLKKNIDTIQLQVFKEVPAVFSVQDRKIEPDGRIALAFNKPLLKPSVQILEPKELDLTKSVEISSKQDTALIWLPELTFDSLQVAISEGGKSVDTVILRRNKRDTYTRTIQINDNVMGTKLKPGTDILLQTSSPVSKVQETQITILEDSVQVSGFRLTKDTTSLRRYHLKFPWKLNKEYILKATDGAFTDAFGNKSKVYVRKFSLDTDENYGSITIKVTVPDTSRAYIVQWLNEKDEILKQDKVIKNTVLNYTNYPTAKYYLRVIYDENKNGQWDTGNLRAKKQPEKTWTFDKIISLRPNWDLEENMVIPKPQ